MRWELLMLPFIGGAIGYATNVLAIKMLFRPQRPWRIPGTPWELQGLLPKRKRDIAANVARTVDEDLLPFVDVEMAVSDGKYQEQVLDMLVSHVDARVTQTLPRLLPSSVRESVRSFVREAVKNEAEPFMNDAYEQLWAKIRSDVRLGEMVRKRIENLDLNQLENLVMQVAKSELKHIEILGAILGFIIGLAQMLFLWFRFG